MKSIIKNLIIGVVIVAIALGLYYYFTHSSSKVSSLVSSSGASSATSLTDQITLDTAFLSTLIGLSGIKIDTAMFNNKSFSSLVDNHVKINSADEGVPGRQNPFAPIDAPVVLPPSGNMTNIDVNTNTVNTSTSTELNSNNTNSILNRLLNSSNNKN